MMQRHQSRVKKFKVRTLAIRNHITRLILNVKSLNKNARMCYVWINIHLTYEYLNNIANYYCCKLQQNHSVARKSICVSVNSSNLSIKQKHRIFFLIVNFLEIHKNQPLQISLGDRWRYVSVFSIARLLVNSFANRRASHHFLTSVQTHREA